MILIFLVSALTTVLYSYVIINDKSIIIKFYFFITIIAFPFQGLFLSIFKFSHPLFIAEDTQVILICLIYVVLFGSTLYLTFKISQKLIPNLDIINRKINLDSELSNTKFIKQFFLISISIIFFCDFLLIGMGSFFSNPNFLTCSNLEILKNIRELFTENDLLIKLHQPIKIIAEMKYMLFFIIGEVYRNYNSNYQIKIIYHLFFIAILILAFIKGTKVLAGLFILLYLFSNRKILSINLKKSISSFFKTSIKLLGTVFLSLLFFRLIAHFRNLFYKAGSEISCKVMDIPMAKSLVHQELQESKSFFIIDLIITRLNYLIPMSKAYSYVTENGFLDYKIYFTNFYGFIPRLFWSDKPNLTNDMNIYAYKFGITSHLRPDGDYSNLFSVSFRPEGESFIYLGWLGLLISFFAGIIFSFIEKLHHKANIVCFSFYIYLVYILATSDVYFALIPSIVQAIITFLILLIVLFFTKKINKYL